MTQPMFFGENPVLVEACAGSAAVTRRLLGAGRILGYQGGKDGYADAIIQEWEVPKPEKVLLNDPGSWGIIWTWIIHDRRSVVEHLGQLADKPPRELWQNLKRMGLQESTPEAAAMWLCRLAGTYSGAEIGGFKGAHKRRPNVDGYIPSRSTLAQRVKELSLPVHMRATTADLGDLDVSGAWVYIDPPYAGRTGYLHSLSREKLVTNCLRLAKHNQVAVSESSELDLPWRCVDLARRRKGQCRRNSRNSAELLYLS